MQNADVQYGSGAVSDPFTGGNRYIPGQGGDTDMAGGQDPFTGCFHDCLNCYTVFESQQ